MSKPISEFAPLYNFLVVMCEYDGKSINDQNRFLTASFSNSNMESIYMVENKNFDHFYSVFSNCFYL